MPKITLTAEEEIQFLRELDIIQELMPGLEVQIVSEPQPFMARYVVADSTIGDEFRTFLRSRNEPEAELVHK